ncbi:MAG TPA: hypothetical protein VJX66_05540 [Amycolatopsis sp.]|nr:hypothetical protein [Amycolatopsis sp.]
MTSPKAAHGEGSADSDSRAEEREREEEEQEQERDDEEEEQEEERQQRDQEQKKGGNRQRDKGQKHDDDLVKQGLNELVDEIIEFAKYIKRALEDAKNAREAAQGHGDAPDAPEQGEKLGGENAPDQEARYGPDSRYAAFDTQREPLPDVVPNDGTGDELPTYEQAAADPLPNYYTPELGPQPGNSFGQSHYLASHHGFDGNGDPFNEPGRGNPGSGFGPAEAARLPSPRAGGSANHAQPSAGPDGNLSVSEASSLSSPTGGGNSAETSATSEKSDSGNVSQFAGFVGFQRSGEAGNNGKADTPSTPASAPVNSISMAPSR